jgi:hypothetical protein
MADLTTALVERVMADLALVLPPGTSVADVLERARTLLDATGGAGLGAARAAIRQAVAELSREAVESVYASDKSERPVVGADLHVLAEKIIGRADYTNVEYVDALVQAQAKLGAPARDELRLRVRGLEIREQHPGVSFSEALAIAEAETGDVGGEPVRFDPDEVQQVAVAIAARRGVRLESILDVAELLEVYAQAEDELRASGVRS